MAKLVTCNTAQQHFVLSNTVYRALSNACVFHFGSVSNTNLEKLVALYAANGLRSSADHLMGQGQKTDAGITVSYLEGTLKANSE